MLVPANTPPSRDVAADVKRSLPEPCGSVEVLQLASGFLVALPAADRQAELVPAGAAGIDAVPAGPSTVLSWNGWLNSTVPPAALAGGTQMSRPRPRIAPAPRPGRRPRFAGTTSAEPLPPPRCLGLPAWLTQTPCRRPADAIVRP